MPGLTEMVRAAGVVGAGGAGFPTDVKLAGKVKTLIINGAECELLMTVDGWLLLHEQEALLNGLKVLIEHFKPEETFLCIKRKRTEQVNQWKKILETTKAKIMLLDDFYPAGDEHILVYEVTGQVIPSGGIPLDVEAVVLNVETLLNVEKASRGQPVTDKYVTVAGQVKRPGTYLIPVGVSYSDLLEAAGRVSGEDSICIDGGPMMGHLIFDLSAPVSKATKGLVVLPQSANFLKKRAYPWEVILKQSKNNCEICRMCTDLCPRFLIGHPIEPHKVMVSNIFNAKHSAGLLVEATLCVECGVCQNFSCPVDLSPMRVVQEMKKILLRSDQKYRKGSGQRDVRAVRDWRKISYQRLLQRLNLEQYEVKEDRFYLVEDTQLSGVTHLINPPFGVTGKPVVIRGDRVKKGDLLVDIAEAGLGSKTHASIDGEVVAVTEKYVVLRRE